MAPYSSILHRQTSAYFLGIIFCLYRAHSIWRTNLGNCDYDGRFSVHWSCLFRLEHFSKITGAEALQRFFPPVVVGPVIIIIGMGLAPIAVDMSLGKNSAYAYNDAVLVSMVTLLTTLSVAVFAKGLMKLIPIMFGITAGYILCLFLGLINFQPVIDAPWFSLPKLTTPEFNLEAILYMLPIAIAPAVEHVGGIMAISSVTGKDF